MPHTTSLAASQTSQPHQPLRRELRRRLLALPYRAFLQAAVHVLKTQGYTTVRPAGRSHWKGRNQSGGWDAEAELSAGTVGTLRSLVQVKQFDTLVVAQRQVDELRGSCLRAGAHQAVLITLSTFSPVARKAAETAAHVLPMRLIDGEGLLDLMLESGLGIGHDREGELRLDEFYFHLLHERFGSEPNPGKTDAAPRKTEAKNKPQEVKEKPAASFPARPSVTVIVRLATRGGRGSKFPRL